MPMVTSEIIPKIQKIEKKLALSLDQSYFLSKEI